MASAANYLASDDGDCVQRAIASVRQKIFIPGTSLCAHGEWSPSPAAAGEGLGGARTRRDRLLDASRDGPPGVYALCVAHGAHRATLQIASTMKPGAPLHSLLGP